MELEGFTDHFRQTFPDLTGSKMVIALSGGADSTALLHLLNQADVGLTLHAVHVHHGTRGKEADDDARFCETLCRDLGIAFTEVLLGETVAVSGQGREACWRAQRYSALERIAGDVNAHSIATAHHRDDVAEGVLLQILRGAGPRAMAGIHSRNQNIIRPLLPFSGSEIREWLTEQRLPWCEDSSNQSPKHLRNRVRHEVLPVLEGISPAIRSHLTRLAQALAESERFMAQGLEDAGLWIDPWHPDGGVPVESIARLPQALQIRWLHSQVARVGLPGATHRQGELLRHLLSGATPALTLARRWTLRRSGGFLWLDGARTIASYQIELQHDSEADLPIPGWRVRIRTGQAGPRPDPWAFAISTRGPVIIRCLRPEDRLENGRRASSVLRSVFPRHLRRIWPILFDGDKLLWIPGVTADGPTVDGPRIVEVNRK